MTDQENQPSGTFRGYVLFLPYAGGSKSESFRPVLATSHGANLTLYRKGDNPFENESIRPFHGKFCEVAGAPDRERRLIEVESIEEMEEPFKPAPSSSQEDESSTEVDDETDETDETDEDADELPENPNEEPGG